MVRKPIVAILLLVSIIVGGGCMSIGQEQQPQMSLRETALAHMKDRYGVEFEYSAPWGDSLSGTHMFLATTPSLPDELVLIEIENFREDDRQILDNFIAVKHRDATIEFLHSRITEVFAEANIFYDVGRFGLSPDLSPNATLSEFLADTRVPLVAMVEIRESDFVSKEQAVQAAELIAESGAEFDIAIVVVEDDLFGTFTFETLANLIPLNRFIQYVLLLHRDGNIDTTWLERE